MLRSGLTFDDVLLVPQYNGIRSRRQVTTTTRLGSRTFAIPFVSSNMDTITAEAMARRMAELGGFGVLHRFQGVDDNVAMLKRAGDPASVGVSIGLGKREMERAEALVEAGAEILCVDVAHAHFKVANRMVRDLRTKFGRSVLLIAGNVATYAGADYLAAAGADAIKVGIGPGSSCTTRVKTGFGVPQLTAILDCRKVDRALIADGGVRKPADAVKALAAGASFVMLGGLLAGTDETPGDVRVRTGADGRERRVKSFRGMASRAAQEEALGGMADWRTEEGVSVEVPSRGPVAEVVGDLVGGLRSGLTYAGAASLEELQRKAEFMVVTAATLSENEADALRLGRSPERD
jgi:IMP dehydrogenase